MPIEWDCHACLWQARNDNERETCEIVHSLHLLTSTAIHSLRSLTPSALRLRLRMTGKESLTMTNGKREIVCSLHSLTSTALHFASLHSEWQRERSLAMTKGTLEAVLQITNFSHIWINSIYPKLFFYQFTKSVFDFRMPWNGCLSSIFRININIVFFAMPF